MVDRQKADSNGEDEPQIETTTEIATETTTETGHTSEIYKATEHRGTYTITAYCGCAECCGKSDGITASGVKAVEGVTVAADTDVLPFGTQVEINGNIYTVQDKGGAIKGNRIDVYFESHQKALEFGRKTIEIKILGER